MSEVVDRAFAEVVRYRLDRVIERSAEGIQETKVGLVLRLAECIAFLAEREYAEAAVAADSARLFGQALAAWKACDVTARAMRASMADA